MRLRNKMLVLMAVAVAVLAIVGWQWQAQRPLSLWLLHTWVFCALLVLWHHAVLRKPVRLHRSERRWHASRLRASLALFSLPILLTLYLLYLALVGSPFMDSRSGHQFVLLTGIGYVVCLGTWMKGSHTGPSPLRAQARDTATERVEIHYSRPRAALQLVVLVLVSGWLVVNIFVGIFGNIVLALASGIALVGWTVFLLPALIKALRALTHREPVLIFDDTGITDTRLKPMFAAWQDIGRISLGYSGTWHTLRVAFRHSAQAEPYVGRPYMLKKLLRMSSNLSDWNISLWLLDVTREDAFDIARTFQHRSRRSQLAPASRQMQTPAAGT